MSLSLSFQLSTLNYGYSLKSVSTKQIYEESLYLSFKEFHSIKTRDEKIEDNFRALKQELQQEAEALSNASTEIMSERFEKLKKGQVDRSNDVKVRTYLRYCIECTTLVCPFFLLNLHLFFFSLHVYLQIFLVFSLHFL